MRYPGYVGFTSTFLWRQGVAHMPRNPAVNRTLRDEAAQRRLPSTVAVVCDASLYPASYRYCGQQARPREGMIGCFE